MCKNVLSCRMIRDMNHIIFINILFKYRAIFEFTNISSLRR